MVTIVRTPAKAAPAPAPVKNGFVLTPARRALLKSIRADLTKPEEYEKTGKLVKVAQHNNGCTAYALLDSSTGKGLGFVFAEAPIRLDKLVDKDVAVKGTAYRVSDWKHPVVGVGTISVVGE